MGDGATELGGARLPKDVTMLTKLRALVNSQVTLDRCACRAVGLPRRWSLGLVSEMVAWIGRTKRFTLFTL